MFWENMLTDAEKEMPYSPDTTLFNPNACVVKEGVIYDAVVEVTDSTILIATCNGDKEMLFNNGKSVYMPADGGEFYSYRIEEF